MDIWAQIAATGLIVFVVGFGIFMVSTTYDRLSRVGQVVALSGLAAVAIGLLGKIWS